MRGPEYLHSDLKRSLDLAVAYGSIPSTSPIWLAMYCYNRLRGEPLLFKQERIGVDDKAFFVLKFETLYSGAELTAEHSRRIHLEPQERERSDPRTPNRVMAFMRRTGLNELPQAINVIRNQMSIVGPRPLPSEYIEEAEDLFPDIMQHWRETVLNIKPGVVGVSPLTMRRIPVEQFEEGALADIKYFEEATFWKDLSVISEAVVCMFR